MKKSEAINILQQNHLKITDKRLAILDVLVSNEQKLLTVDEIYARLKKSQTELNLTTVYRNLEHFTGLGILHKLILKDQCTYYKLSCYSEHHHHLICENCGAVTAIEHCPLDAILPEAEGHHFQVNSHKLEVYGICSECQSLNK